MAKTRYAKNKEHRRKLAGRYVVRCHVCNRAIADGAPRSIVDGQFVCLECE